MQKGIEGLKSALKWRADFNLEFAAQTRLLTVVSRFVAKRPFQHSRKLKFPVMLKNKEGLKSTLKWRVDFNYSLQCKLSYPLPFFTSLQNGVCDSSRI